RGGGPREDRGVGRPAPWRPARLCGLRGGVPLSREPDALGARRRHLARGRGASMSDRAEQGGLDGASQESAHAESPARARSFDLVRFQTALRAAESATSGAGAGRGRFGRTLVLFDIVASTQEEARALARRGAPDGTVALAEEQSGG